MYKVGITMTAAVHIYAFRMARASPEANSPFEMTISHAYNNIIILICHIAAAMVRAWAEKYILWLFCGCRWTRLRRGKRRAHYSCPLQYIK